MQEDDGRGHRPVISAVERMPTRSFLTGFFETILNGVQWCGEARRKVTRRQQRGDKTPHRATTRASEKHSAGSPHFISLGFRKLSGNVLCVLSPAACSGRERIAQTEGEKKKK